jgi:hypothetical protein
MLETIKEKMQIQGTQNLFVIPLPNHFPCSRIDGFSANVAGNTEFRLVSVCDSMLGENPSQIVLAQFGTVHAHRIAANVYQRSHSVNFQPRDNVREFSAGIAKRKEVRGFCRTGVIPDIPVLDLLFS